jgi:transcriptional regulator with XRE-family HTH domain
MAAIPEVQELRVVRLEDNLTFRQLARLIGVTHGGAYKLLTAPGARPNDRTLFRIRRYLQSRRDSRTAVA